MPVLTGKAPKRTKGQVLFRSTPELIERIDRAAAQLHLSRTETMTQLLDFALSAHEREVKSSRRR